MRIDMYRQRGLGLLAWIMVLAVLSFSLTCLLKVGPVYMDSWTVQDVLDDVTAAAMAGDSRAEIRRNIQRRLDTNRVDFFNAKDIRFEESDGTLILDASYERRVPLIANIDVVVKFDGLRYSLQR